MISLACATLAFASPANAQTRHESGTPGPGYWQSRVDYDVSATLDPRRRVVTGAARITYHNNSPDTLRELHWHLYQNAFRAESPTQKYGTIAGRPVARTRGMRVYRVETPLGALTPDIDGTLMRTALQRPLSPRDSIVLHVAWDYEVPDMPTLRTGSRGQDFAIGQWYPQISVYDDVRGWNDAPYLGPAEFYLEYGRWTARLTVPANFIVAATGTLQNAAEVLTDAQRRRLDSASRTATTLVVDGRARKQPRGNDATRTWIFTAESVRDFVWAASPRFAWEVTRSAPTAAEPRGVLIQTFYPRRTPGFQRRAAELARDVVELYNARYGEYPYPQLSVLPGPVSGIEYPMLVFTAPADPFTDLFTVINAHEIAHQWYPMAVGTNETREAFLDEGTATFMAYDALETLRREGFTNPALGVVQSLVPRTSTREIGLSQYVLAARGGGEVAMTTPPDSMHVPQILIAAYEKPAATLRMLRDVVGDSAFYAAMREFHTRWRFRHPRAEDFFATVENVAGAQLDWFWNAWYRGTATLDLAVADVRQEPRGSRWSADIVLARHADLIMPVTVRVRSTDGSSRDLRVSRAAWPGDGPATTRVHIDDLTAPIASVVLDPGMALADVDRRNDRWPRARTEASSIHTILSDLLPAVGGYRLGIRPTAGYNDRDGGDFGFGLTRSYLAQVDRFSLSGSVGTRSGRVDGRATMRSTFGPFGSGWQYGVDAFHRDGRAGGSVELEVSPRAWGGALGHEESSTAARLTLSHVSLLDSAYVPTPSNWTSPSVTTAALRLTRNQPRWFASPRLSLLGESGLARGEDFWKGAVDLRLSIPLTPLTSRTKLTTRGIAAWASEGTPPQTAWYLAGGSPFDELQSAVLRSRGTAEALGGLGDKLRRGGGGAVFGAERAHWGRRLAAANATIEYQGFGIFGDMGRLWSANDPEAERWISELGYVLGFQLPPRLGQFRMPNVGLRVYAPLWLWGTGDRAFDAKRRRFVLGARWGD